VSVAKESAEQRKRTEEIAKTFNLLLNSLDPGFLWGYLGEKFQALTNAADQGAPIEIGLFAKVNQPSFY
jgi:hypothetical protein